MDDPLSQLLAPSGGGDPLDDLVKQRIQQRAIAATMTAPSNPDAAGQANALARETGAPPETVERNLPDFQRQAQLSTAQSMIARYPAIGTFMSNPRNAAVVGPDVGTMGTNAAYWLQAVRSHPDFGPVKPSPGEASYLGAGGRTGLYNLKSVVASAAAGGLDLRSNVENVPIVGGVLGNLVGLLQSSPLGKYLDAPKTALDQVADQAQTQSQSQFDRLAPDQRRFADLRYATLDPSKAAYLSPTRVTGDILTSLPTMGALALTGYLTRGASLNAEATALAEGFTAAEAKTIGIKAAATMAARVGAASEGTIGYQQQKVQARVQVEQMPIEQLQDAPAFRQLVASGYTPEKARGILAENIGEKAGAIAGLVDAGTNYLGGPILGKLIGEGGAFAPRVVKGFLTEGAQEGAQSFGEQVGGNLAQQEADPHQALLDGALEQTIQGFVVGGAMGGATAGGFGHAHEQGVKSKQAEITGTPLDQAMDAAAENPVRKRDPEAFRQFVDLHTAGTPIEHMFVPAEKVAAFFQSQDGDYHDDDFWSKYAPQIDEGLITGGDVVIPTSDAAAHLAGTPAWDALRQDVRTSPDGMSMAEAKAIEKQRPAIMEKLGAQLAEHDLASQQAGEPHRQIYEAMRDKLVNAGFTADAAHLNALLVAQTMATRAERLGTTLTGSEASNIEVNRVLPEHLAPIVASSPGSVALKSVIAEMRRGAGVQSDAKLYGPSLLEWIAKQGGIEDRGGDIASMGGETWHKGKPGVRRLIREHNADQASMLGDDGQVNTNSPDELAARAQEAGYFEPGERPTVNDLLDAIGAELRGAKHYAVDRSIESEHRRNAAEELRQLIDEAGLDPAKATEAEIRKAVEAYSAKQEGGFQQADGDAAWARNVDRIVRGESAGGFIRLGRVPQVLRDLGLHASDMVMSAAKIARVRREHPEVSLDILRALPALLRNPEAAFPSDHEDGSIVVAVPAQDADGNPVVVPLIASTEGRNVVLSVYGKDGGAGWIATRLARAKKEGKPHFEKAGFVDAEPKPGPAEATPSPPGPIPAGGPTKPARAILSLRPKDKETFEQGEGKGARGQISFVDGKSIVDLFQAANMSTFSHELGHHLLEQLRADAQASVGTDGNEAARQTFADWEAVKAWFNANGHPVDGDTIPVEAHELFARGFERFLMEGKAPSSALKRVFEGFKRWMLQIYRTVDNLRAPITPEIREVMGRLLATDDEIDAMHERQSLSSLFTDAAQAGMSEAEFAEYEKAASDASQAAHDALLYRAMKTIRDARTKAWKAEEVGVRDEVAARIDARPEFRAMAVLRDPTFGVKLDRAWLVDNYGPGILAALPKGVPPIYAEKGSTHADEIAERTGFASGDEMIRTLVAVEERKMQMREAGDQRSVRRALIDEGTTSEMRARHGDPFTDGSIEEEALAAVHNDRQGGVIATELRALSRQLGTEEAPTPYALARDWARAKIASGTVNEMTSGRAIRQYANAAAKAGKAAEIAIAKNDLDETHRQKLAQMLNSALVSEAGEIRERIETAVSRMARFGRRRTMESMDQSYLEQIHDLLEQVELRERSQRSIARQQGFEAWANARQAEGFDVVVPASFAESLGTIHWSQLTVEKLLGLDDTVQQIAHIGRLKQKLLDGQDERNFADMIAEADRSMAGMTRKPVVDGFLAPSALKRARSFVLGIDALMLKMETVMSWLDQGKPNGFFTRVIFQRFVDAQEQRRLRLADMKAKLEAARQEIPAAIRKTWGDKVTLGLIDQATGLPAVMTRDQIVMLALNLGNEGNAWKLARGYGWNEGAILREVGEHLKAEEWTYVQKVWDHINELWPDIAALERRINGVEPEKVEPRAVQTPFGELPGGYFPVVYDPTRNLEVEKNAADDSDALFSKGYRRATTRAGSTNERTGFRAPILLSLSVIDRHIGEVIHDITHREAVMDANRFLNDPKVVTDIRETLGVEIQQQIQPWLRHIANEWASDAAGTAAAEKFFKSLRTNATFVGIGFRVSTILQQGVGLFNTAEAVGSRWLASGIARFAQNPLETTRFVLATSQEVAARMETMDRDIKDAVRVEQAKLGFVPEAKLFAFQLIGWSDRFVSVVSWIGGYNRGLSENMTEQQAIAYADKIVRQSQGGGAAKDMAAIQRGKGSAGEASKLTTMFYSYMSQFYQRQRTLGRDYNQAIRTRSISDMPGLLARTMWLYFFPALASELIGNGMPECDDAECWTAWAGKAIGMAALGPIPVVRDIAGGLASGFGYNFTPASGLGRTVVGVGNDIYRLFEGEETKHATKDALDAIGYATGKVPGQVSSATQFLVDVAQGDQNPQDFAEWYRGLTTGHAEKKKP